MKINFNNCKIYNLIRSLYYYYDIFLRELKLNIIKFKWLDLNKHNKTIVGNSIYDISFPIDKVNVGISTYGPLIVYSYGNIDEKLIIGNYCSISSGVLFILGGNHNYNIFSTYPFKYFINNEVESISKGPIIVEDDVWIGTNSIILSGVTLAKGTIVAAGSVVTKSSEPYTIIGGNPAKLIKKRFSEETIIKLMHFNFENVDEKKIFESLNLLYQPLTVDNIDSFIENLT